MRWVTRTFGRAALVAVVLAGCHTETTSPVASRRAVTTGGGASGGAAGAPVKVEQAVESDPCAERLHEISGALLEYYAIKRRMPNALEELQAMADIDRPLNFTCPKTGKPYGYAPDGLSSTQDDREAVVYDAAAHAGGERWVILMRRPSGRQTAALWVVPMAGPVFAGYTPNPPGGRAATTAPAR